MGQRDFTCFLLFRSAREEEEEEKEEDGTTAVWTKRPDANCYSSFALLPSTRVASLNRQISSRGCEFTLENCERSPTRRRNGLHVSWWSSIEKNDFLSVGRSWRERNVNRTVSGFSPLLLFAFPASWIKQPKNQRISPTFSTISTEFLWRLRLFLLFAACL